MKVSFGAATFVLVTGVLMIGTGALAQRASDAAAAKAKAPIAHLAAAPRSLAFGVVKQATIKSILIKNTGNMDANVTVSDPPAPFTVIAGGGSFLLAPGEDEAVSVQFAPTAKGPVKGEMEIQCSNCNTAADDNVAIHLSGNAKEPVSTPSATPSPSTANALPISVTAGPYDAVDYAFASVTICAHGTSNCTTVNYVTIDTASFGLRVFGSQIAGLGIVPNAVAGGEIGECAFFVSGSTWGGVATVDVQIAGEPTITIPIQVIDDQGAFAPAPADCTQGAPLISSPQEAGLNGLLGIGQVSNDTDFTEYFNCSGENCSALNSPPNEDIVPNPVSALPVDNNGVVVSLPSIPATGEATTNGTLYFGIGTQNNNQPGAVKTYLENSNPNSPGYLDVDTTYKGTTAGGFFDTGSNAYFFNDGSIKDCLPDSVALGFYCPAQTLSKSATNASVDGSVSGAVKFQVANADNLLNSNNAAFDDLGGTYDGGSEFDGFDWGLPFFFGRSVYIGMVDASSPLGTGPYIAY